MILGAVRCVLVGVSLMVGTALAAAACGDTASPGEDGGAPEASLGDAGPDGIRDAEGDGAPGLALGLLQFHVVHNLQDSRCLQRGDCGLVFDVPADEANGWLRELEQASNMAVLHWDRAIPWLVFDETPDPSGDIVSFYDERLDPELVRWVDAFASYFGRVRRRYLAVSILDGTRTALQAAYLDSDTQPVPVGGPCPDLTPGQTVSVRYDPGTGPVEATFEPYRAYRNFVFYLAAKLEPHYLALLVEANLFALNCPGAWPGLVELYRRLHDEARQRLGPDVLLFATLTLKELLGFRLEDCMAPRSQPCTGDPEPPDYPTPDPQTCYPLDLGPLRDLDEGGGMDVLALSFYPDALVMSPGEQAWLEVYPEDWDGTGTCLYRMATIPFVDPFAALDRVGWEKPVAIAEMAARSCPIPVVRRDGTRSYVVLFPGNEAAEAFWLSRALEAARQRHFLFYVHSFLRDYEPLGLWAVQQRILDPDTYSLLNWFACMGLEAQDGALKESVVSTWRAALE